MTWSSLGAWVGVPGTRRARIVSGLNSGAIKGEAVEPGAVAFQPLSVSDLIDETFRIFRRNFLLFVGICAVLMVPVGLIAVFQQVAVQQHGSDLLFNIATSGLVELVRGVVYVGVLSATFHAFTEVRAGRNLTIGEAYNVGMERFPAMLWVGILYTIALAFVSITIIGIPFAIFLSVAWLFGLHATAFEGKSGRSALARSRALVKGDWWRVLGITFLVSMVVAVVSLVFSIPGIALSLLVAFGRNDTSFRIISTVVTTVAGTAGAIVTGPVVYIASVLLYFDLRARKEGFDLEIMANQAEASARSASLQS